MVENLSKMGEKKSTQTLCSMEQLLLVSHGAQLTLIDIPTYRRVLAGITRYFCFTVDNVV